MNYYKTTGIYGVLSFMEQRAEGMAKEASNKETVEWIENLDAFGPQTYESEDKIKAIRVVTDLRRKP